MESDFELKKIIGTMDPVKLGTMFANCCYHSSLKDSKFRGQAFMRLSMISEEWTNQTKRLPPGSDRNRPVIGVLKRMGYEVSDDNFKDEIRRSVIDYLMEHDPLPPVKDAGYMAEWGRPFSAKRLGKFQRSLQYFIAENIHRPLLEKPVRRWQADLKYSNQKWSYLIRSPD